MKRCDGLNIQIKNVGEDMLDKKADTGQISDRLLRTGRELIGHLSHILEDDVWEKIDIKVWNDFTSTIAAAEIEKSRAEMVSKGVVEHLTSEMGIPDSERADMFLALLAAKECIECYTECGTCNEDLLNDALIAVNGQINSWLFNRRKQDAGKVGEMTQEERLGLLEWVSACQSAYCIDQNNKTPYSPIPGQLKANRRGLIEYVESMLAQRKILPVVQQS